MHRVQPWRWRQYSSETSVNMYQIASGYTSEASDLGSHLPYNLKCQHIQSLSLSLYICIHTHTHTHTHTHICTYGFWSKDPLWEVWDWSAVWSHAETIFILLSLFWKNKSRFMLSPRCVSPPHQLLNGWTSLYENWYVHHDTWAHLNDTIHTSFPSVCMLRRASPSRC
jgi:hypothetical protein